MHSCVSRIACLAGITSSVLLGPSATAADLLAGGTDGAVYLGDSDTGNFVYYGCICLLTTQALAFDDNHVYGADPSGAVELLDRATGDFLSIFWVPNSDATDVVVHGSHLLVSSSSGTVDRVDPIAGTVISTMTSPIAIQAMAIDGDDLYIAGTIGEVYKGSALTGDFQQWGSACLAPVQALALDKDTIYAGDLTGAVLGFDLADGSNSSFVFTNDAINGMVIDKGDVLVSHPDGNVYRYDPLTGALISTMTSKIPITALEILPVFGDLDGDGVVSTTDLFELFAFWGPCAAPCAGDLDGDGVVGITDLFILFANWG